MFPKTAGLLLCPVTEQRLTQRIMVCDALLKRAFSKSHSKNT
jgi:hypothetical protein